MVVPRSCINVESISGYQVADFWVPGGRLSGTRDAKTYERANNVRVKKIWVRSLKNFTLFCQES